ncbi:MAG: phosphatase PAP2 family protein [Bacteroidetes bacterium]|nr:phosphatase PAP2 family protein [Bacteroidota bacterium]
MKNINTKYLRWGIIVSLICALIIFIYSFALGKEKSFLLLNNDWGKMADLFFSSVTYLGDGIVWLAVLLITWLILKRKDAILLLFFTFLCSTIIAQLFKYVIAPNVLRPIKYISDPALIHMVPGVELHTVSSFPSGHATTAFSIYLFFCLLLKSRWWLILGLIYSLIVAYSRIYLAQHFPEDIAGGIIAAILSVTISYIIVQKINYHKNQNKVQNGNKIS